MANGQTLWSEGLWSESLWSVILWSESLWSESLWSESLKSLYLICMMCGVDVQKMCIGNPFVVNWKGF